MEILLFELIASFVEAISDDLSPVALSGYFSTIALSGKWEFMQTV